MVICVDIYCRVSTDPQEDNTGLDEQEAAGRAYCLENGLVIGMVHRETFTGYKYRDGKIQGVVVRTLDRLSRRQIHAAILLLSVNNLMSAAYCRLPATSGLTARSCVF